MPEKYGYGKLASKKLGIPMKHLRKMKHKKGNISRIQKREDYAQEESE